jgi:hypothetical protein
MIFVKKKGPWTYGAEVGVHRFFRMNKTSINGEIGYAVPLTQDFSESVIAESYKKPFFIEDSYKL